MNYRTCNRTSRRPMGQVLVLVTVGIVAILGALALCTDVAVFYFNWSQLRKEADAAALAGASYLPSNTSQATTTAAQYVALNGEPGDSILQNTVGSLGFNGMANSSLTVQLSRTVPYYFGKVFGLLSSPVVVLATAAVQPVSGADGWLPIAMPCSGPSCYSTCVPSSTPGVCGNLAGSPPCYEGATQAKPIEITLTTSSVGPGNWEPIVCTCSTCNGGASTYQASLSTGCTGDPLQVNGSESLDTKPGNMANATYNGISQKIGCSDPATCGTPVCPQNQSLPSNRQILLPIMDTSQFQGRTTAPVYGFLDGWIVSVSKSAGATTLVIDIISGSADQSVTPDPNGPNTGPFAPILIQ